MCLLKIASIWVEFLIFSGFASEPKAHGHNGAPHHQSTTSNLFFRTFVAALRDVELSERKGTFGV